MDGILFFPVRKYKEVIELGFLEYALNKKGLKQRIKRYYTTTSLLKDKIKNYLLLLMKKNVSLLTVKKTKILQEFNYSWCSN